MELYHGCDAVCSLWIAGKYALTLVHALDRGRRMQFNDLVQAAQPDPKAVVAGSRPLTAHMHCIDALSNDSTPNLTNLTTDCRKV